MKRLVPLLLILGGIIGGFTYTDTLFIPLLLTSIAGGFIFGLSVMVFTAVYSGKLWGVKFKIGGKNCLMIFLSAIGIIIGGFSIVRLVTSAFSMLFGGMFIDLILNVVAIVGMPLLGMFLGKILLEKILSTGTNYLPLGNLPLFTEIDQNMEQAEFFVVSFEGVALYSKTNYCYSVYFYEDYQLGDLTTVNEVALVGSYFVQKYHDRYTFKIDSEVIPGEPGQTAVAVGSGGVAVVRTSGTPTQINFRSYIFTKKK